MFLGEQNSYPAGPHGPSSGRQLRAMVRQRLTPRGHRDHPLRLTLIPKLKVNQLAN